MNLKILILGANGFIGSSLIEAILREKPWVIYGVDIVHNRLRNYLNHERFRFTLSDITVAPNLVDELIEACDVVLPLAAIANPFIYVTDPLRVFELDFEANLRIIRQCVFYGKRIVFPSTSEVYGISEDGEFDERKTLLTRGPIHKERWIYSCSKELLDRIIYAYGTRGQLSFTLFRPFNWIGPTQDDPFDFQSNRARVVPRFLSNILSTQNLKIIDGGKQRRSFTDITDGIEALLKIIENGDNCAESQIFNIGNPKNNCSIAELAKRMLKIAGGYSAIKNKIDKIKIINVQSDDYYGQGYQDMLNRTPAIAKAKKCLNWRPKVDLDRALRKIFDYYLG